MLTPLQKVYLTGIALGATAGVLTTIALYEEQRKNDEITNLTLENSSLKVDKKILQRRIEVLESKIERLEPEDEDDTEESEK